MLRLWTCSKIVFIAFILAVGSQAALATAAFDSARYIDIDEIQPGMDAYCLTVYRGTKIEKFPIDVISVVRNIKPGHDAIMVTSTDERFIHTGPVAGCSGSPVYIEGRLAGALAFGWSFSKDPLYGVTPIREMLETGTGGNNSKVNTGFSFDYSQPIDLAEAQKQMMSFGSTRSNSVTSATPLLMPLSVSGIDAGVCQQLDDWLGRFGMTAVAGVSGSADDSDELLILKPGSILAVPLVSGDIDLSATGTVTEVVGDDVYGFGHPFFGFGPINLPMAGGKVHTVVASLLRSFKLASPGAIIGTLSHDEAAAVRGRVGVEPNLIDMTIKVTSFNDTEQRIYNCRVADDIMLTPLLFKISVLGAMASRGNLPPRHTLRYRTEIEFEDRQPLSYESMSTNSGFAELITETSIPLAMVMSNPFKKIKVKSISCRVEQTNKSSLGRIWSVDVSDTKVEPGETITVTAVIERMRGTKKQYDFDVTIPAQLKPGQYEVLITGGYGYTDFLQKVAPQRFVPENVESLIKALNYLMSVERDRLYCVLTLPPGGIALESAELPDLPGTKAMVLANSARTLAAVPYHHWIEKSVKTDHLIVGDQVVKIEVTK